MRYPEDEWAQPEPWVDVERVRGLPRRQRARARLLQRGAEVAAQLAAERDEQRAAVREERDRAARDAREEVLRRRRDQQAAEQAAEARTILDLLARPGTAEDVLQLLDAMCHVQGVDPDPFVGLLSKAYQQGVVLGAARRLAAAPVQDAYAARLAR